MDLVEPQPYNLRRVCDIANSVAYSCTLEMMNDFAVELLKLCNIYEQNGFICYHDLSISQSLGMPDRHSTIKVKNPKRAEWMLVEAVTFEPSTYFGRTWCSRVANNEYAYSILLSPTWLRFHNAVDCQSSQICPMDLIWLKRFITEFAHEWISRELQS